MEDRRILIDTSVVIDHFRKKNSNYSGSKFKGSRFKVDGFVKSLQGRHSREGGSPEVVDFLGFPPSRE